MPLEIVNAKLYLDRTVQLWHRTAMARDADAIDLDLVGFCRRCRQPLYMIEATTNPEKGTYYLRKLAAAASVPALLVLHSESALTHWRLISPTYESWQEDTPQDFLQWLRDKHATKHHRDSTANGGSGGNGVGRAVATPARRENQQ